MRYGSYGSSVRESLRFHVRAWCLCVEEITRGTPLFELEKQLFSDDAGGRQWRRWKNERPPNPKEFFSANVVALTEKWIPKEISDALVDSFSDQSSNQSESISRSGWSQTIAMTLCRNFAEERNNAELRQLCMEWSNWIESPDEKSEFYSQWLAMKAPGWKIEDQEILKEKVEFFVQFAASKIVELGIDDPITAMKAVLNSLNKNKVWSESLRELIAERNFHENEK